MTTNAETIAKVRKRKREAGLRQFSAHIPLEQTDAIARVQKLHGLKNRGEALERIIASSLLYQSVTETEATS